MAKIYSSALALVAALSSASAFAPIATTNMDYTPSTTALNVETPLSPLTIWGSEIGDIKQTQQKYNASQKPEFAKTISAKDLGIASDKDAQLSYVKENAFDIKKQMVENGAVIFRDFDLMKEQEGFVSFYEAIGMKTCLDPLHSVSARPTVDGKKDSPVYEAVNKESRKNFFIGKHEQEFVKR